MNKINYLIIFWLCGLAVQAQTIIQAEYFFDIDPGTGSATPITGFSPDDTLTISSTISTSGLSQGFHFLAVRVKDANNRWSHFEKRGFYIHAAPVAMPDLVAAEYFFDQDPGTGNATSVSIGMTNDSLSFMAMIPQSLAGGFHTLSIRVKDANGRWSFFEKRTFYVSPPPVAMPVINGAEFFRTTDPGVGSGSPLTIGTPADTINPALMLPISDTASLGQFFYAFRARDVNGRWSHFAYDTVTIAISAPPDTSVFASPGLCTRVVNDIDPTVINSEPFGYTLTGATTGSGSGSASGLNFNSGITTVTYTLDNFPTAFSSLLVTVMDDQLPGITCPANISIDSDAGICGAVVNYVVTVSDNCPDPGLIQLTGLPSGSTFPSGVTTNTFRVTDGSGNSTTCSFTVTIGDVQPPMITCPANITVNADPGLCTKSSLSLGSPVTSDNCGVASTTNNGLSTYPVGITNVTWTVTDINGLTATCIQTVTVVDNQDPIITCPANITENADPGTCSKTVTYVATATDNCGISGILYNPTSGSSFPVGTTLVTATATDVNGRTSSCTFNVTIVDNQDPSITCPANINQNASPALCSRVVAFTIIASDNCAIATNVAVPPSGSSFSVGTTLVTATATDVNGRTSMCTFNVTIVDNQNPSITCPANITINVDAGLCTSSMVMLGSPATNDNCAVASTVNNAPGIYPKGMTNVTWTVTDVNGLTATCIQTVNVVDNQLPMITCPSNITINNEPGTCQAIVNFSNPTFSDNCPGVLLSQTTGLVSGSSFPVGLTTNTFIATDVSGNTASCTMTITVIDNEFPTVTCPANINLPNTPGACGRVVTYSTPTTENCPGAVLQQTTGLASGSTFPIGTTINTFIITDASGNSNSCSFTVTITDNEIPTISCPANTTVNTDVGVCGKQVNYVVSGDDNCPGEITTQTAGLPSGSVFPVGLTINTFNITDASGNSATCSFTITVIDIEDPAVNCPENIVLNVPNGDQGATVNYTVTTDDNCPGETLLQIEGLPSGSFFPLDTTTNIFVVSDASGNMDTCSFDVIIIDNPILCPNDTTVNAAAGLCSAVVNGIDATTIPSGQDYNYVLSGATTGSGSGDASGTSFNVGVTTVVYTLIDLPQFSCTFIITVLDTQAPEAFCPANITVSNDADSCSSEVLYGVTTDDNCPGETIQQINGLVSGSSFPLGLTTNSFLITDASGNTATCSFTITVNDNQAPAITCPANITVSTDSGLCSASSISLGAPVVSDNCGIAMTTNNGLSIYPIGMTNILWTTTDVHGLTATCMQTVTAVDNQNPVITNCPQNIMTTTDPGECSTVVNFSFAGTDNCGLQSIVSTPFQSGEEIPSGTHLITILATDIHGNTSTCTFTVEITDDESPQITCPAQINDSTDPGVCTGIVIFNFSATDNCPASPSVVNNPASGSAFPVGSTIVTSTATDASGNTSTCTFTVVINDVTPPTIECQANITVNTDSGLCTAGGIVLNAPFVNDNCGIASTTHNAPVNIPKGTNNVIWTTTDIHGNSATCIQIVTVIDNEPPLITCPSNLNVFGGPGAGPVVVNYPLPTFSDNCPGASIFQSTGLPSGSAFPLGITTNTFIVTDAGGLTNTCSFTINVKMGKVGVNTITPLAILHVADSSVLFSGPTTLPVSPGPPPTSGAGNRWMWYPEKAALRAGGVQSTQWNRDSIGLYSIAAGFNTKAKEKYTGAFGFQTEAIGEYATAIGADSKALGDYSSAIGTNVIVTGDYASAFGKQSTASGMVAVSFSNDTDASGLYSSSFGNSTIASGIASTAFGNSNSSMAAYTSSFGGPNAVFGISSTALGIKTEAKPFASLVLGANPDTLTLSRTSWNAADPVFVIGNGLNENARHTAFSVYKNGKTGINTYSPSSSLHVIKGAPSGGPLHSNAMGVFEDNVNSYIQLSSPITNSSGILSGNDVLSLRSALVFEADSSMSIKSGGDNVRVHIETDGKTGVGAIIPEAMLDVNGTFKLGVNGTALTGILKDTVSINLPLILANDYFLASVSIPGSTVTNTVFVTPAGTLNAGIIINSVRVSSAGNVSIQFANIGLAFNHPAMDFYFVLFQ